MVKLKVEACVSTVWGIYTYRAVVEYDRTKPTSEFTDAVRSRLFMQGATAILHYNSVDGFEDAKCLFKHELNEDVRRLYLDTLEKAHFFATGRELLRLSNKFDHSHSEDLWKTEQLDDGKWCVRRIDGSGCRWRWEELNEEWKKYSRTIYGYTQILQALGVDVNDVETTKRILDNLGFNRMP